MAEREYASKCIDSYTLLAGDERYKEDAFLWFRLAQAQMEIVDDLEAARNAIVRAKTLLDTDPNFPAKSQYRMVIPRMEAFFRWQEYEGLPATEYQNVEASGNVRAVLLGVIADTMAISDLEIEPGDTRGSFDPGLERAKTLNNWLDFSAKFIAYGGSWEELATIGVDEKRFRDALTEFEELCGERMSDLPWASHTLTLSYDLLGDGRAGAFAKSTLSALEAGLGIDADDMMWLEMVRKDATNILEKYGENPG